MNIGLIDVDSHNWPNLALMKLSAWHKAQGDTVEWWTPEARYHTVYASKVFEASPAPTVHNADEVVLGGSGIDLKNKLRNEIEHMMPDYSIYSDCDFALGFLTRGCPRVNHTFCITPQKDGCKSIKVADLSEFWAGQRKIMLLDQNLLACKEHRIELLRQLAASGAWIEFNGGMDVRYMNDEIIEALRAIRVKDYHFAWDDPRENLLPQFETVARSGLKSPSQIGVYVLTNYWSTLAQNLYRIYTLRSLGFMPFVMIYNKQKFVDSRGRWLPGVQDRFDAEQLRHFKVCQHMQRWCGNRAIIKSCPDFEDYEPYRKMLESNQWVPRRFA